MKKKAILGIETLVIFIAMILVAGVAAFVLIRTSGLLQQRALAVSSEAISRVGTGFEIIQIVGNANTASNTIDEFEILGRLAAGSETIELRNVGLTYVSGETSFGSVFASESNNGHEEVVLNYLGNASVLTYNMDNFGEDFKTDSVKLIFNYSGNHEGLAFDLSHAGKFNISLGVDLESSTPIELNILDVPILHDTDVYGYVKLNGTVVNVSGALDNSLSNQNFTFIIKKYSNFCTFNRLRPEYDYCMFPQIGDTDTKFETGELLVFRFKVKQLASLASSEDFEFNFVPKTGVVTTVSGVTPDVFSTYKTRLWP